MNAESKWSRYKRPRSGLGGIHLLRPLIALPVLTRRQEMTHVIEELRPWVSANLPAMEASEGRLAVCGVMPIAVS